MEYVCRCLTRTNVLTAHVLTVIQDTAVQRCSFVALATCNFGKDGPVQTDYVRATHVGVPLLDSATSEHNECKTVEFIDIRNKSCIDCKVLIAHSLTANWPIHVDSYYSEIRHDCSADFSPSNDCGMEGEDNFGNYRCVNNKHRCSAANESTTQLWFGGK